VSTLGKLFDADGLLDLDEISGPIHWPDLTADEAAREWGALRPWVERLMARISHLDHHVIPHCWFLHNGHVEALSALQDQERVNLKVSLLWNDAAGGAEIELSLRRESTPERGNIVRREPMAVSAPT
jgi:hypothetical protein